jgi:hypothetical protein
MAPRFDFDMMSTSYTETVAQAAILLVAMSFKPDLQFRLLDELMKAVEFRGGYVGGLLLRYDLAAAVEDVAQSAARLLSTAMRAKLPGVADDLDEAFVDQLRRLLGAVVQTMPTM